MLNEGRRRGKSGNVWAGSQRLYQKNCTEARNSVRSTEENGGVESYSYGNCTKKRKTSTDMSADVNYMAGGKNKQNFCFGGG